MMNWQKQLLRFSNAVNFPLGGSDGTAEQLHNNDELQVVFWFVRFLSLYLCVGFFFALYFVFFFFVHYFFQTHNTITSTRDHFTCFPFDSIVVLPYFSLYLSIREPLSFTLRLSITRSLYQFSFFLRCT